MTDNKRDWLWMAESHAKAFHDRDTFCTDFARDVLDLVKLVRLADAYVDESEKWSGGDIYEHPEVNTARYAYKHNRYKRSSRG